MLDTTIKTSRCCVVMFVSHWKLVEEFRHSPLNVFSRPLWFWFISLMEKLCWCLTSEPIINYADGKTNIKAAIPIMARQKKLLLGFTPRTKMEFWLEREKLRRQQKVFLLLISCANKKTFRRWLVLLRFELFTLIAIVDRIIYVILELLIELKCLLMLLRLPTISVCDWIKICARNQFH